MYDNFENLQKKARKYYFKKRVVQTLFISITLFIFFVLYLFLVKMTEQKKEIQEPIKIKKEVPIEVPKKLQEESKREFVEKPENKVKIEEKIIKDIDYKLQLNSENIEKLTQFTKEAPQKQVQKKQETPKLIQQETKNEKSEELQQKAAKPVQIVVKRLDSISKMIRFYEKENRYSLAIEIAQKYYDIQDYKNSLLWSKKANLLNKNDYKAWLLYAKSEYNQNNRSKAIKILKLYLRDSSSQEVQGQLLTWTKGE